MPKKTKVILALSGLAVVLVVLVLGFVLGRNSGDNPTPVDSQSQSTQPTAPPTSTPSPVAPPGSASGSIPFVGPIDSPIIGKWEDVTAPDSAYGVYLEFVPDGTLYMTQFYIEDKDYPENWWTNIYNFSFETWRDIEVLESGYFMGYAHHRVEFYELDGRQAMDIITIKDDGEEYITFTLLKLEE